MTEYLTTREVAKYLRLNEKKVYSLVSAGQLPAARISGKWLFPKHLVDSWMEQNTVFPTFGLMNAVLADILVIQGSDDWLFSRVASRFQDEQKFPVASAKVGSLAGLSAVGAGKAHLCGCHVENQQVEKLAGDRWGCYLLNLLQRSQGLIYDRSRHPQIRDLADVCKKKPRFAQRQELSGTYRLVERLCKERGMQIRDLVPVGPFSSHLELALSIRSGQADAGVGIRVAAELCGLDFIELATEPYKLAVPVHYASHPRMAKFLDFVTRELKAVSEQGVSGYGFDDLGKMEAIGNLKSKGDMK
jgi:putative molybdopterin biosynthesis protein